MDTQSIHIKKVLENLYGKYNRRELIKPDPLQFIYRYSKPADMEIAGFLAAALAYGRVQQIEKDVTQLLNCMSKSPHDFVSNFKKTDRKKLSNFKHRFTTGENICDLLELLRDIVNENSSIEKYFLLGYNQQDENIIPALSKFCESLLERYSQLHDGQATKGLKYLLVSPIGGSACKRLNLFLRWMVRDDDVDTGLWKSIDKSKLIVPIDVHMGRLCRFLGFYSLKTVSLSAAVEITKSFSRIVPDDPVKYDFALSRVGIVENCTGRIGNKCQLCELLEFCIKQKDNN